jgi:hypothetical protein
MMLSSERISRAHDALAPSHGGRIMTDIPTYPRTLTREALQHQEGALARRIEKETAKLPSDAFLWAAATAVGTAAILQFTGKGSASRFVGQWVAPFLLLGLYNKIVKVAGSDRVHAPATDPAV